MEVDVHVREPFSEGLEESLRFRRHPDDGGAHPQETLLPSLRELCALHGSIGELQRQPGVIEERLAGFRDLHPAAITGEELHADGAFELQDLLGEPGLGDVEVRSRSSEVALLSNRDEVPELPKVDRHRILLMLVYAPGLLAGPALPVN